jgi:hypothetical protein
MISAAEARKRAQMSQEAVDKFLEELSPKIAAASDKGLFEYRYSGQSPYDPTKTDQLSMESFMTFTMPEFWKLAIAKLQAFPNNYGVTVKHDDPYVPRGLADDDGNGPEYVSYYMLISW